MLFLWFMLKLICVSPTRLTFSFAGSVSGLGTISGQEETFVCNLIRLFHQITTDCPEAIRNCDLGKI
jgi:hypothetical protein